MKRMSESRMRDLVRSALIESEIEQGDGDRYSVAIERLMRIIATGLIKVIVDSGFNPFDQPEDAPNNAVSELGTAFLEDNQRVDGLKRTIAHFLSARHRDLQLTREQLLEITSIALDDTLRTMVYTVELAEAYGVSIINPADDMAGFVGDVVRDRLGYMDFMIETLARRYV